MKKILLILLALASTGVSASNDETFEWSNNSGSTIKVYRNGDQFRAEVLIKRYCEGNGDVQNVKVAVNDNWYYIAKYCFEKESKLVEYQHNSLILESLKDNASTIIDGVNFPHGDAFNKWLYGASLKTKPEAIFTYEPWVVADNDYAFTRSTSVDDNTIYFAYLSSSGEFHFISDRTCNYNAHINYADTISVNGTPVKVNNICIKDSNRVVYETIPGAGVDQIMSAFKRLNHVKVNEVVFSGKGFTKAESDLKVRNTQTDTIQPPNQSINKSNGLVNSPSSKIVYEDRDVIKYVGTDNIPSWVIFVICGLLFGLYKMYAANVSHSETITDITNKNNNLVARIEELTVNGNSINEANQTIVEKNYTIQSLRYELETLKRSKGGVSQESLDKANETIRAANKRISELKVEIEELRVRMNAALDRANEAESSRYHSDKYEHSRSHTSEALKLRDKISTLETKITNLATEKMKTDNELIGKKIECEKWEEDYRQLKIRHDNLERNAHNGVNSADLGEVKRKLRTTERTLDRVTKERDDYKNRWEELYRKGNSNDVDLGEFKQLTVPHILLGLRRGADKKEVRERIRRLSPFYHPDKGADGVMMKLLNQAANDM